MRGMEVWSLQSPTDISSFQERDAGAYTGELDSFCSLVRLSVADTHFDWIVFFNVPGMFGEFNMT